MARQVRLLERGDRPEHNRDIPVNQSEFLIGRGADCDLRVRSTAVSRHHCIVRVTADEVLLLDLGSSNGSYVNGERVRSQAVLHSGDELHIGETVFVLDLGDGGGEPLRGKDVDPLAATLKLPPPGKRGRATDE